MREADTTALDLDARELSGAGGARPSVRCIRQISFSDSAHARGKLRLHDPGGACSGMSRDIERSDTLAGGDGRRDWLEFAAEKSRFVAASCAKVRRDGPSGVCGIFAAGEGVRGSLGPLAQSKGRNKAAV